MDERYDVGIAQSASTDTEDYEVRKLHANLIADAQKKGFHTREALEDYIRERQAEIDAAVQCGFDVDEKTRTRAELASDELRKLLPLRLILHLATDLAEMIQVLQVQKEGAMRSLDMEKARTIQSEIDELQDQMNKEKQFLLTKRMGETKCLCCGEMFLTEMETVGILKMKKKHCEKCRVVPSCKQSATEDVVDMGINLGSDDKDNNSADTFESVDEHSACVTYSFKDLFGQNW
eukprot:CAMPEP_0172530712 /NCGR_PEP_ID=MMETSP1067-20121228/4358_1 /TAXON_ID=265564 ORGANISM="Thalassiosira punctigera, Strain Tpunct2005C2" /NCGR_SAMPLE_ID=MMETSP1067 /ASSEMBLY_ACC=CAM_ASM_000444 /LENGTH=233 /DNA_ID=CAMNT_0013314959 /DNA_START=77 /DNA_END=775 /DNA_ORIENTATION=+